MLPTSSVGPSAAEVSLLTVEQAKFSSTLENVLNVNSSLATEITKKVLTIQKGLGIGQAFQVPPSDSIPAKFVVTSWALHCLNPQAVGKVSFSDVYRAVVIPTTLDRADQENFSPSKPKIAALKVTQRKPRTFSPEKRKLDAALASGAGEGIDKFLETYKDNEGYGISLNLLYDTDLSHANFHLRDNPIHEILTVLISSLKGLREIHESNCVHRDLKGGNILARFEQPATPQSSLLSHLGKNTTQGVITDFGMLNELQASDHYTSCTPKYVDPSQFGSPEMSIFNQKKREGLQTKEGDIFSIGITIWKDVIEEFILQISKRDPVIRGQVQKILEKLNLKPLKGPFRDEHLKVYGKTSNYRMIHSYNREKVEVIIRHRQLENVREVLTEACSTVSSLLTPREITALRELSLLSCMMQEVEIKQDENTGQFKPDYAKRPSIQSVMTELERILTAFQEPVKKRRLDLSVEADAEDNPFISQEDQE